VKLLLKVALVVDEVLLLLHCKLFVYFNGTIFAHAHHHDVIAS
jgi:hypothetical protein